MMFQISAPWVWGFQFDIDDNVLALYSHEEQHKLINSEAKRLMNEFFRRYNLMDIVDYLSTIKHFSISGNMDYNNNQIVYLCYHEGSVSSKCC